MRGDAIGRRVKEDVEAQTPTLPHAAQKAQKGMERALKHRDKLLEYDRTRFVRLL